MSCARLGLSLLCVLLIAECIQVSALTSSAEKSKRAFDSAKMEAARAKKKAQSSKKWLGKAVGFAAGAALNNYMGGGLMQQKSPAQLQQIQNKILKLQIKGVISRVSKADSQCVICQFVLQRVRAEMLMNGIGGSVPFGLNPNTLSKLNQNQGTAHGGESGGGPPGSGESSFLEEEEHRGVWDKIKSGAKWVGKALFGGAAQQQQQQQQDKVYRQYPTAEEWEPHQVPPPAQRTRASWLTKRERNEDLVVYQPTQTRYGDLGTGPMNAEAIAQERFENNQMFATVYQVVEEICTKRMPKPFFAYCGGIMRKFQEVANGLRWRDRPDAICMALNFCSISSYVQSGPHSTYKDYY